MKALAWLIPCVLQVAVAAAAIENIDPDELRPGEPGICITEMDGGERVEIPLEVIGVLNGWTPEGEIVLVRLQGERYEQTGIIAGMSGSPVYVRDRLVGALAFGWAFSKEPIGGVTPFLRMQDLAATGGKPNPVAGGRPQLQALLESNRAGELDQVLGGWLLPGGNSEAVHLPLAVSTSSADLPGGSEWLDDSWQRLGWVSAPAGRAAGLPPDTPLQPGSMISAVLVEGDATIAASGTVTAVDGDRVWAFGHSFLGGGEVQIPFARSTVIATLASTYSSFKMVGVGETVGAIQADASHGIFGTVGAKAYMIPIQVDVGDQSYNFRAVRHPILLPYMIGSLTASSFAARGRVFGNQTVRVEVELSYQDGRQASVEELYATPEAVNQAAGFASLVVAYLENSSFEVPDLAAIRVGVQASNGLAVAEIVDVVPDRPTVRPGETLTVRVRIQPRRGERFSKKLEVQIPPEVGKGRLELIVADGASWSAYDFAMRPHRPASFADELGMLDRIVPANRLVMVIEQKGVGLSLQGGSVSAPPGVVLDLRSGLGNNLRTTSYRVLRRVEDQSSMPLFGAQRVPLTVRLDGDTKERGEK